ncbi:MAG: sigma-E processing peptidase SpoIIGA [Oscillospiraceae bacterium]|jgi:stage II sporulation protein GA (sporulation sigma-E factor processing peptidase)|nr:sigma-E processing peptidase SpoIIGA [Oscillospiraceae bacterium]
MRVVYADTLFLLNFAIDYILLLISAKICDASVQRLRLAAAAALGGAYSVVVAVYPGGSLASAPAVALAGLGMAASAFLGSGRAARLTVVFFAASAAFAGAALAVARLAPGGAPARVSLRLLFVTFAVCYAALSVAMRGSARSGAESYATLTIRLSGKELRIRALLDTGSSLRDPMTGSRVIVIGAQEIKPLFPHRVSRVLSGMREGGAARAVEELGAQGSADMRFVLVPYSAVGVAGGLLPAFRPDAVEVDGAARSGMLIAVSPNSVSDNGVYSALMPAGN